MYNNNDTYASLQCWFSKFIGAEHHHLLLRCGRLVLSVFHSFTILLLNLAVILIYIVLVVDLISPYSVKFENDTETLISKVVIEKYIVKEC